ncbi:T9SS type A sorting domain-containing protein [Flectobacillus longus]|uniref:T9SS type A sorting domain-containing protein n=1 Tax=Flectobacillus longus TaxID=2984207 RepID=UPI0024B6602C|nr:T9SS type A sorting domain-containing protein [Flectobacillus longus]MDI9878760.1 T9SS type A sorting domain-containing protein [Flectobacillus longus]
MTNLLVSFARQSSGSGVSACTPSHSDKYASSYKRIAIIVPKNLLHSAIIIYLSLITSINIIGQRIETFGWKATPAQSTQFRSELGKSALILNPQSFANHFSAWFDYRVTNDNANYTVNLQAKTLSDNAGFSYQAYDAYGKLLTSKEVLFIESNSAWQNLSFNISELPRGTQNIRFVAHTNNASLSVTDFKVNTQENASAISLQLYPNPTTNYAKVNLSPEVSARANELTVMGMDGTVYQQEALAGNQNDITISVENLRSGMYFVRVSQNVGSPVVEKLVVRHE